MLMACGLSGGNSVFFFVEGAQVNALAVCPNARVPFAARGVKMNSYRPATACYGQRSILTVLRCGYDAKIYKRIVRFIVIDMVNLAFWPEPCNQGNSYPVGLIRTPLDAYDAIAVCIDDPSLLAGAKPVPTARDPGPLIFWTSEVVFVPGGPYQRSSLRLIAEHFSKLFRVFCARRASLPTVPAMMISWVTR